MNKLLIVGHSSTPSADIEKILHQCGMAEPRPSRKEGLSPRDVSQAIRKASGGRAENHGPGAALAQLKPGAMWQGLVLDLMLGNIDQDFWGWSDSDAIQLLDYWKELDPTIKFVLVYSDPRSILANAGSASADKSKNWLDHNLKDWCAYNSAILEFHNFNRDRSVLVHADEALSSVHAYLQQLRIRLDAPLNEPPQSVLPQNDTRMAVGKEASAGDLHALSIASQSTDLKDLSAVEAEEASHSNCLAGYLGQQLLLQYPDVGRLYEELQSVANLPSAGADSPLAVHFAWIEGQARERQVTQLRAQLNLLRQEALANVADHKKLVDQFTAKEAVLLASTESVAREKELLRARVETLETINASITQEQQLLKTNYNSLAADNLKLRSEGEKLRAAIAHSGAQEAALRNANSLLLAEKNDHHKERTTLHSKWKQLESENELLLNQLHVVQEELEKYHQEIAKLKKELADIKSPKLFGAAERVKGQLEYRLGALMIQRSKSFGGWIGMLGALRSAVRTDGRGGTLRNSESLPPIANYRDAHEAERVKRHLSYRLGRAYLENTQSVRGWARLPFALRREIQEFQVDRASKN